MRDAGRGQQVPCLQQVRGPVLPVQCVDGTGIRDLLAAHDTIVQSVKVRPGRQLCGEQVEQVCWQRASIVAIHDQASAFLFFSILS